MFFSAADQTNTKDGPACEQDQLLAGWLELNLSKAKAMLVGRGKSF